MKNGDSFPGAAVADPMPLPEREAERLRNARLADLTHELLAPIHALVEYCDLVVKDATELEHAVALEYFQKIRTPSHQLLALVREALDPARMTGDRLGMERRLRHELRAPLNPIRGYCELLLEEAEELFLDRFVPDVQKIYQLGEETLSRLDELLAVIRDPTSVPRHAGRPESQPWLPPSPEARPATELELGRILVVDDNEHNRDLLARRLTRDGHAVSVAANGREALTLLRQQQFDLVLLDIMMPEVSGFEVLEEAKRDEALRHVPIVMISALNEIESAVFCIEAGAEDYLTRPVNPTLLRARINASLEKKRLRDREVEYRQEIERERKRADDLLHVILPGEIVRELKETNTVRPRRRDEVAVLFADIVGFTPYCESHSPEEVLDRLQLLVETWETIAQRHQVDKIKTIGDAFMAACGLLEPVENPVRNTLRCASEMIEATHRLVADWNVRIGINVGPVVAGVLGKRQYLFDLWGDTVNTAARLESHGVPGGVTLSETAWQRVASECEGTPLGEVQLKGKRPMQVMRFDRFLGE